MNIREEAKKVLQIEAEAIISAEEKINDDFVKAVDILKSCTGKVVVAGIGKSGLIGQKICATLSSTGTPSVFIHPVEAVHGDIGLIMKDDAVLILSQSGETEEIIRMIPAIKRLSVPVIAVTGKTGSSLAKAADCVLDSSVAEEACPMNLAPTASTTVQLALGDALAVVLLKSRDFKKEDFAMLHPGGALGRKLVLKVKDVMHKGEDAPSVAEDAVLKDALWEITKKRFGCTAVTGKNGEIKGIFTDGDLRRLMENEAAPFEKKMNDVMTASPALIGEEELAAKALAVMEEKSITVLLVPGENNKMKGIIHLHDILKAGVV
ncbi:MAG TPA: KpsF/GutQ family sugar-phosphate isomerase [Firmicutes bacterium]|nr:KpsF/GutQ family sugar-phosphate isomerase [Bacillota bacterium]